MKANSGMSSTGQIFREGLLHVNPICSIFTTFVIYSKFMQIIDTPRQLAQLWQSREIDFTEMMKIVVDINLEILAIDGEMHADLEEILLENGSQQMDLWGANIYPMRSGPDQLEFTSFINIRPSQGNRGMEIVDPQICDLVRTICSTLLI